MTLTDDQAVVIMGLAQKMVEECKLPLPSEVVGLKRLLKESNLECIPRTTTHNHSLRAVLSLVRDGGLAYQISGYAQLTPRQLTHVEAMAAIKGMRNEYGDAAVDGILNTPGNFLITHFDLSNVNQCREVIDIVRCLHLTATGANVVVHQPGPTV